MIFIDSNVFISLWDLDNSNHHLAISKIKKLRQTGEKPIISNIVIYEAATVISMRVSKAKSLEFLKRIMSGNYEIIHIDESLDRLAQDIFKKIKDKNVAFFDCCAFALIEKYKIGKVFSFDKDFVKYGKKSGWEFV